MSITRASVGRTLGRIPIHRVDPPPVLPAVPIPVGQVGSTGRPWREVLREMIVAFKEATGGRNMRQLLDRIDGEWESRVKEIVGTLMDEGMSGATYVAFVCDEVRKLRGRPPFAAEVFSVKSVGGWIRAYRTTAPGLVASLRSYEASPERRRLYQRVERE